MWSLLLYALVLCAIAASWLLAYWLGRSRRVHVEWTVSHIRLKPQALWHSNKSQMNKSST